MDTNLNILCKCYGFENVALQRKIFQVVRTEKDLCNQLLMFFGTKFTLFHLNKLHMWEIIIVILLLFMYLPLFNKHKT